MKLRQALDKAQKMREENLASSEASVAGRENAAPAPGPAPAGRRVETAGL